MKTRPWAHQLEDFEASRDFPAAALPWEPRCGKSKISIDTAAYLYHSGRIDAAIVVAPNGVHLNWTREEVPTHWASSDPFVMEWESARYNTKGFQNRINAALKHDGFVWLAVNVEAVWTPNLRKYLGKFVAKRRCLLIIDESHSIKNPKARRTKALLSITEKCPYRRTLTGTPVAQGPFDLWAQYNALDPAVLGKNFHLFKQRYGVFKKVRYGNGPSFDELVEYRNLDELNTRIAPITFPRKKSECLDLPERLFTRRYFILPPAHRLAYDELKNQLITQLEDDVEVTAQHALTLLLRLQQISRGHVTADDGQVYPLGDKFPAAEAAIDMVKENPGKSIIWCRFRSDVEVLVKGLQAAGMSPVRCDGSVPQKDRPGLRTRFREDPTANPWIGTLSTGGVGVDLGAANLMIFYSHGFDLVQRLQGLERNYGSTQKANRVDVVDLVAADTADMGALKALERKEDLASKLTGKQLKELIT